MYHPVLADAPSREWVTLMQEIFNFYQQYFFSNITSKWSIRSISKHLFQFVRSPTKIIEFDDVKCPKSISSKNVV